MFIQYTVEERSSINDRPVVNAFYGLYRNVFIIELTDRKELVYPTDKILIIKLPDFNSCDLHNYRLCSDAGFKSYLSLRRLRDDKRMIVDLETMALAGPGLVWSPNDLFTMTRFTNESNGAEQTVIRLEQKVTPVLAKTTENPIPVAVPPKPPVPPPSPYAFDVDFIGIGTWRCLHIFAIHKTHGAGYKQKIYPEHINMTDQTFMDVFKRAVQGGDPDLSFSFKVMDGYIKVWLKYDIKYIGSGDLNWELPLSTDDLLQKKTQAVLIAEIKELRQQLANQKTD